MTVVLVLARPDDAAAARLARHWRPGPARVLTPNDLGRGGWDWRPGADARLRLARSKVHASKLRGVLVRLDFVTAGDLPEIHPCDREFVAAELTAFLAAFLQSLRCPVFNQPVTPQQLNGPAWTRERWLLEAQRCGIATVLDRRSFCIFAGEAETRGAGHVGESCEPQAAGVARSVRAQVIVVGDECFTGRVTATDRARPRSRLREATDAARELAAHCRVALLTAVFEVSDRNAVLIEVSPVVDAKTRAARRALFHLFTR